MYVIFFKISDCINTYHTVLVVARPKCEAAQVANEVALAASGFFKQGCLLIGSYHVCPSLRGKTVVPSFGLTVGNQLQCLTACFLRQQQHWPCFTGFFLFSSFNVKVPHVPVKVTGLFNLSSLAGFGLAWLYWSPMNPRIIYEFCRVIFETSNLKRKSL